MKQDIFRINDGEGFAGIHEPNERWNGWAQPYFTIEVIRNIARWLESQCGEGARIVTWQDGRAIEITYDGETYELPTCTIDGVTYYTTDGWVWDCDSDLEEVEQ